MGRTRKLLEPIGASETGTIKQILDGTAREGSRHPMGVFYIYD